MTKSLMISIQPQHAFNILNGKKTLELRTWIPKGYVGWVYVYVTKGKFVNGLRRNQDIVVNNKLELLNGKVSFRFWFDEYEKFEHQEFMDNGYEDPRTYAYFYEDENEILNKLCISLEDMEDYGKGKDLYAWHIKKLEIFDEPKELSDFYTAPHFKLNNFTTESIDGFDEWLRLKKPPQRSVWVYGN